MRCSLQVQILENGVYALRVLCLQDTDYLKDAEDGQEHVYHSMHTVEYNSLKSLVTHSGVLKLGHTGACAIATRDCAPPVQACLTIIGAKCTVVKIIHRE